MKKLLMICIIFSYCAFHVNAQTPIVVDPALTATVVAGNSAEKSKMNNIENLKEKINATQAATTLVLKQIDNVQNKVLKGLSEVNTAVSNLYQIKYCYSSLQNVIKYEGMMLAEAKKNPVALAWAYKNQKYMYERALLAYSNIAALVLKAGNEVLMDSGQRTQLIFNIYSEIQVIEAYAISSYFNVKRVVQAGIWQSINPFKDYINMDKKHVNDILRRVQF